MCVGTVGSWRGLLEESSDVRIYEAMSGLGDSVDGLASLRGESHQRQGLRRVGFLGHLGDRDWTMTASMVSFCACSSDQSGLSCHDRTLDTVFPLTRCHEHTGTGALAVVHILTAIPIIHLFPRLIDLYLVPMLLSLCRF